MYFSSKNTMRTLAVGVVALSVASLASWAFADHKPGHKNVCDKNYLQEATVHGKTLAVALDNCYVNRPAGPAVDNCVNNAFKTHYQSLLDSKGKFDSCSSF